MYSLAMKSPSYLKQDGCAKHIKGKYCMYSSSALTLLRDVTKTKTLFLIFEFVSYLMIIWKCNCHVPKSVLGINQNIKRKTLLLFLE